MLDVVMVICLEAIEPQCLQWNVGKWLELGYIFTVDSSVFSNE